MTFWIWIHPRKLTWILKTGIFERRYIKKNIIFGIPPQKLTWNVKNHQIKKPPFLGFHVHFPGCIYVRFRGGVPLQRPFTSLHGPRYFLVGSQHRRWGDSRWKSRRVELAAQDLQGPFKIKVVSWSIQDMNTKMDFGDLEQRFQWIMFKSPNMYKFQISSNIQ